MRIIVLECPIRKRNRRGGRLSVGQTETRWTCLGIFLEALLEAETDRSRTQRRDLVDAGGDRSTECEPVAGFIGQVVTESEMARRSPATRTMRPESRYSPWDSPRCGPIPRRDLPTKRA